MKAFQLIAHGAPGTFRIHDIPSPALKPDEVLVRVRACGLNRLDLWAEQGGLPVAVPLPLIPGCEIAGEIVARGSHVKECKVGDRVAVQSNIFCGECEFCLRGEESLCLNGVLLGVQRDGGFAEEVAVPARAVVRIPNGIPYESCAAVTLAGSTAMHMLTARTQVEQGDWVLVIGAASGVGSAAIQIAKQLGAYVITTGSNAEKRALGKKLGADHVLDATDPNWPREVRALTKKRGVDLVVEHVGGDVLVKSFECLARDGRIVTCGATAGRNIELNLWPFFVKQHSLIGSYGRNRTDMIATLDWVADGKLKPVIDRTFPLAETAAAYAALRSRSVLGKLVVTS